jgi:hypothetical protein
MILQYGWELSMHQLKDLNFKIFVFFLKFKKYRAPCFFHSQVIDKYWYRKRFYHRKVKISHSMIKFPIEYKQIIISSSRTEIFRSARAKKRVANLVDFFSKKAKERGHYYMCYTYVTVFIRNAANLAHILPKASRTTFTYVFL